MLAANSRGKLLTIYRQSRNELLLHKSLAADYVIIQCVSVNWNKQLMAMLSGLFHLDILSPKPRIVVAPRPADTIHLSPTTPPPTHAGWTTRPHRSVVHSI